MNCVSEITNYVRAMKQSAFYPFCPHPHFILFVRILSLLSASAFYPFCPHPHFNPFVRPSACPSACPSHVRPHVRPRVRSGALMTGSILVPRALLTRGQRSATRGSGQIHIKLASDWLQRRLLF